MSADLPPLTRIAEQRMLFVMATAHEYGRALRERIEPLITGVGPIEAALATGVALERLRAASALPDLVVALGSSGSRRLPLGSVWQVASVSWRDMDATPLGFARGVTPFLDEPATLPLATPLGWPTATLSTGADVVVGTRYDAIAAELVDMETYAIARACRSAGVPLACFRGVSDGAEEAGPLDWTGLLGLLDARLAEMVDALAQAIPRSAGPNAAGSSSLSR